MSSNNYLDVQWVPGTTDQLVTVSTQLKLYKRLEDAENVCYEVQCEIPSPPHYIKCVSVQPKSPTTSSSTSENVDDDSGVDIRVAVGQANGRISLLGFSASAFADGSHVIREFGPRQSRQCYGLAWNRELLAAGFEKNRSDAAILVFDTSPAAAASNSSSFCLLNADFKRKEATANLDFVRATVEIGGFGETCHSLAWLLHGGSKDQLVAGINGKSLKVFDIRLDQSKLALKAANTRAVHGVCVDPFLDFRIASHVDNQVVIWDTRNFDKPIVTHSQNRKVTKLAWSPTRSGLLCSITDNTSSLLLHDIQSWAVMLEDGEPAVTERSIILDRNLEASLREVKDPELVQQLTNNNMISSFAWHPTLENTLVAVTNAGKLSECLVSERIAPSWSSQHCLIWPQGGILRSYPPDSELFTHVQDMSIIMQERAKAGYGSSNSENVNILSKSSGEDMNRNLITVWRWLEHLSDQNFTSYPGVRTALGLQPESQNSLSSVLHMRPWSGIEAMKPRPLFRSEAREQALKLCGWVSGSGYSNQELKKAMEKMAESNPPRAAAISLFCLDLRTSLKVLQRGAKRSSPMTMVAMALSGFTEDKEALWHEMAAGTEATVTDPYLRILFSFLTKNREDQDYSYVIENKDLELADRIAFACLYLPDPQLRDYISGKWRELRERGDLRGLILSGMCSSESVDLLQRYLDLSGDVQTVSWMAAKNMPKDLALGDAPQLWIDSYRDLLNMWTLWSARAEFDIAVHENSVVKKPPQQVYVSCNFCGRCIGQHVKGIPRPRDSLLLKQQQQQQKVNARLQACPACRKPLPRCAVCLINMGSLSGLNLSNETPIPGVSRKISPFENFFTWCQTCRHGGHALHLLDWFREHGECPVSGCLCKCSSLDASALSPNDLKDPIPIE